jgi:5-methylcytosine-specific restriction endonuclease McrA
MGYPSAKYCGPSCRQPAALTLRAAALAFRLTFAPNCIEPGCTEPARKRLMCCTHYNRHYQPNRSRGTSFAEWKRQNPERAVVQEERKRRRRRARQREAVTEPYTLAEIAARDRFICGLCRRRVDMGKSHPHPKSPSIDHKVPISESLDDTRANVQLAHFDCNWRKGARGADEQLFLFG